jgi:hypothetical protein
MTVGATAASAIVAAVGRGIQGVGLGAPPFGDGNAFVTIGRDPAVTAALGATPVGSAVGELVASAALGSHGRLAHTRFFVPGSIRSWV